MVFELSDEVQTTLEEKFQKILFDTEVMVFNKTISAKCFFLTIEEIKQMENVLKEYGLRMVGIGGDDYGMHIDIEKESGDGNGS